MSAFPQEGTVARDRRELAYLAAAGATVLAIVAVEALLVAPGRLLAAQIVDAVLVLALVNAGPRQPEEVPSAVTAAALAALRALALVPLVRVVALGLPMRDWTEPIAVLAIALPVGGVALRLAPVVGLRVRRMFALRRPFADLYAIAAGATLGLLIFLAGAPRLWPDGAASDRIALGVGAAVVAAAVEELVFRGLVQGTLQRAFGRLGMLAATAVFAVTYLDAGSTALVLTFALAGVVFAHARAVSGTLAGVIVGHVLLVTGAGAIWPSVLDEPGLPELSEPLTSIGLSVAIAIATGLACWQALPSQADDDEAV